MEPLCLRTCAASPPPPCANDSRLRSRTPPLQSRQPYPLVLLTTHRRGFSGAGRLFSCRPSEWRQDDRVEAPMRSDHAQPVSRVFPPRYGRARLSSPHIPHLWVSARFAQAHRLGSISLAAMTTWIVTRMSATAMPSDGVKPGSTLGALIPTRSRPIGAVSSSRSSTSGGGDVCIV